MISSLALSGIIGLVGGLAEKITAFKTKKLELEKELALRKLDAEIMQQEWAARTKVAEVEASAAVEVEDSKAFAESYKLEPKKYGIKWLDALRGSIRPLLTLYLVVITSIMYYRTAGGTVNPEQVVETILSLTVMACSWWFGSRGIKKVK
jgi:hypothetical protein